MKITNSKNLFNQSLKVTPCGTQTLSKAPNRYVQDVYPEMLSKGDAGHVWDYDGNEFIDYIAALGPISVGYCDRYINEAVIRQLNKGIVLSLPSFLEAQVARKLNETVPSMEMSKFTKTGSDACSMAVKCARAYTKREKVMVCGYHGWHDWYSIVNDKKAGIPLVQAAYIQKATYNKIESFEDLLNRDFAALIMEPMMFEYPIPGFLEAVRNMCIASGTVLIFDEVVTGGRFQGFAAQNTFHIRPDLTVMSKGIANGMPLAVVGGKREIMQTFERDDVFASTTFGGELLSLAACLATIDRLEESLPQMVEYGSLLMNTFNECCAEWGLSEVKAAGYPTRSHFVFPTSEHKALFWQECLKEGVLFGYSNFPMAAHTNEDLKITQSAIRRGLAAVKTNFLNPTAKLEGKVPVEVFRLR